MTTTASSAGSTVPRGRGPGRPTFLELVRQIEDPRLPLRPDKLDLMRQLEPRARGMAARIARAVGTRVDGNAQRLVAEAIRAQEVSPQARRYVALADAAAEPDERVAGRLERLERFWRACRRAHDADERACTERRRLIRDTTLAGAPVPVGAWTVSRGASEIICESPRGTLVEVGGPDDLGGVTRSLEIVADDGQHTAQLSWHELEPSRACRARCEGTFATEISAANMADCVALLVGGIEYDLDRRAVGGPEHNVEEGERYRTAEGTLTFDLVRRGHAGMTSWISLQSGVGEPRHVIFTGRCGREVGFTVSRPNARHGDDLIRVRALPYETSATKMLAMAVAFMGQRFGAGNGVPAIPRSRHHQD